MFDKVTQVLLGIIAVLFGLFKYEKYKTDNVPKDTFNEVQDQMREDISNAKEEQEFKNLDAKLNGDTTYKL